MVQWLLAVGVMLAAVSAMPVHGQPVRVRALGTAQDGGIPHAACECERCAAAREDPARRRLVASLAIIVGSEGVGRAEGEGHPLVYLIDATPDIREQLDALRDVRDDPPDRVDREPVDGILLTHAHIGHYSGLAFFGFEAISTRGLPVWCTPRMAEFLRRNEPWGQLVRIGNIDVRESPPGEAIDLPGGVRVEPVKVPHRDELSDTVGYRIEGPARTVLYIPDTEPWRLWRPPLPDPLELLGSADILIVDATFYSPEELPGRHASSIGHPLVMETMDLLEGLVREGKLEVYFTHFNHSNPVLDPESAAARAVEARGFRVLREGEEWEL